MIFIKKITSLYTRLRKRFFDGPDWIDLPNYLKKNNYNYRSPTFLLFFWLYAFYVRILTIPGRMIISSVFLVLLYSLIIESATAIRIFAFVLISILFIDTICGFIFRPKLKIIRKAPQRVRAGTPIRIDYTISNLRNIPVWNLHLDPIYQQKWLKLEADIASLDVIKSKTTVSLSAFVQSEKRGEYIFKPSFASSSFPFGIIKWSCRNKKAQKVKVYPRFEPLNSINLPVNSRFQREGISLVSHVGESLEFHACRDFRTGDNAKHIHWPTTARKGQIIVREFQEEYLSRIALIVDTYIPNRRKFLKLKQKKFFPEFEAALSLTAALSHKLAHGDYIVDIFAAGPDIYHFKGGRSLAQLDQILDILSSIEPNKKNPISELAPQVAEDIAGIGSAILLLLNWDEPRKKLVNQLQNYGTEIKILFITDDRKKIQEIPDNADVYTFDEVFSGNVKDL